MQEAKSWLEEHESYQEIIVGKVAKETKARRHQATIGVNMASIKRKVIRLTLGGLTSEIAVTTNSEK